MFNSLVGVYGQAVCSVFGNRKLDAAFQAFMKWGGFQSGFDQIAGVGFSFWRVQCLGKLKYFFGVGLTWNA